MSMFCNEKRKATLEDSSELVNKVLKKAILKRIKESGLKDSICPECEQPFPNCRSDCRYYL